MKVKVKSLTECLKIDPELCNYKLEYFAAFLAEMEIEVEHSSNVYHWAIKGTNDKIRKTFTILNGEAQTHPVAVVPAIIHEMTEAPKKKFEDAQPSEYTLSLWEDEFERWISKTQDFVNLETFTERKVIKYVYHEREWQGYLASKMEAWHQMKRINRWANQLVEYAQLDHYQLKILKAILKLSDDEEK